MCNRAGEGRLDHLPDGAPCVRVPFALLHRVPVGDERVVHLVDAGEAAAEQVERLARARFRLDRLLQTVDGEPLPLHLVAEQLNGVVHPSQLPVDVGLQ